MHLHAQLSTTGGIDIRKGTFIATIALLIAIAYAAALVYGAEPTEEKNHGGRPAGGRFFSPRRAIPSRSVNDPAMAAGAALE